MKRYIKPSCGNCVKMFTRNCEQVKSCNMYPEESDWCFAWKPKTNTTTGSVLPEKQLHGRSE